MFFVVCSCPRGYIGSPFLRCSEQYDPTPPECRADDDCLANLSCMNEKCVDPCTTNRCGDGAHCHVQSKKLFFWLLIKLIK